MMERKDGFLIFKNSFGYYECININHIVTIYLNEDNEFVICTVLMRHYISNVDNISLHDFISKF